MLALALLPTVSHALAHSRGAPGAWAEICTPQGMKLVSMTTGLAQPGEPEAPATAASHLEHCPYCTGLSPAVGLPAAAPQVPDVGDTAELVPRLFLHAPRKLFVWHSTQPRGPPHCS